MNAMNGTSGITRRELSKRGLALLGGLSVCGGAGKVFAAESPKTAPQNSDAAPCGTNGRWSAERVNQWYDRMPWPVGCNFIPSTAINQIETWQAESFDSATMDRELGWAEGLGFNTVRIFLHDLVWEADPDGFKKRLDAFLGLCQKHRQRAIVTFFTNGCYYGFNREVKLGKQPDPIPGVHNSGWVQTPGAASVNDPATWGRLEKYVKDVIGTFAKDERVLLWYLYNEPWNTAKGAKSLPLMRETFAWAREVNPSQPLTSCLGADGLTPMNVFLSEACDVLTFHNYEGPKSVEAQIKQYKAFGRPLLCGEYMARPRSTFQTILPIFKRERVMAMNFGLVAGKGNFFMPWGSKENSPEPKVWLHDILRKDGTPFDPAETALIKRLTGAS